MKTLNLHQHVWIIKGNEKNWESFKYSISIGGILLQIYVIGFRVQKFLKSVGYFLEKKLYHICLSQTIHNTSLLISIFFFLSLLVHLSK